MKILYIGGFELPDGNAAAQRVIANAKILVELGHEVQLYGLSKTPQKEAFLYEGLFCRNLSYPSSLKKWLKHLSSIGDYKPIIQEWKPDVIIAYNYPAVALWRLLRLARHRGIKVVADCTEWYQARGSFFFNIIKNADTSLRMRVVQPRLDGMIAISSYLENFYKHHGMKVLFLPPLVDKSNPKWQIAQSQRVDGEGIRLFYAGTTSRKDRLDIVIRTLMRIVSTNNIKVVLDIIGVTDTQFQKTYPEFDQLPSFVRFHGRRPHQEVLNMLVNHDYQVFIREESRVNMAGFPTKYVESISSGTLVLANFTSDLKDYLKAGVTGFPLDISSEQALETSLLRAMLVPKEEIQQVRERLDTAQFDYHHYVETTRSFLKSIY